MHLNARDWKGCACDLNARGDLKGVGKKQRGWCVARACVDTCMCVCVSDDMAVLDFC